MILYQIRKIKCSDNKKIRFHTYQKVCDQERLNTTLNAKFLKNEI